MIQNHPIPHRRRTRSNSIGRRRFSAAAAAAVAWLALLTITSGLAGCAAVASRTDPNAYREPGVEKVWQPPASSEDERLEAASRIMQGFDPVADDTNFQPGDEILLSIELDQNGNRDLWFVRIEVERGPESLRSHLHRRVLDDAEAGRAIRGEPAASNTSASDNERLPDAHAKARHSSSTSAASESGSVLDRMMNDDEAFVLVQSQTIRFGDGQEIELTSPMLFVKVSVYDEEASFLAASTSIVPEKMFTLGPYESCRVIEELQARPRAAAEGGVRLDRLAEDEKAMFGESVGAGLFSMIAFFEAIRDNRALATLRSSAWNELARRPSLWSVVTNFGVRLSIEPLFHDAEPAVYEWPGADEPMEAFEFPTIARANGEEAVRCRVVAVRPVGPLHLSAGMVYMEAAHPRKPANRLRIQVLAAQRDDDNADEADDDAEVGHDESRQSDARDSGA